MADIRAPDYELAEKDYMLGMKYKDIAEKYNVSINTVKSWKQRYKWDRKGVHTKEKSVHTNKTLKRSGNPNPENQFTKRNKAAEKHGFFSKYLPEETMDIIQEIEKKDPIDILWSNIQIQYAAIIRAQKIMYVKDQGDKTIEKVEEKKGKIIGERWEVQQAWDKQANFLKAQSRAMGELRSLIKQYDELCRTDLATEEQKARIAVLKSKVNEESKEALDKLDDILKDIGGVMNEP